MKTINQMLRPRNGFTKWYMWANDTVGRLNSLRNTTAKPISVAYEPVEYVSSNGKKWYCQHASTHPEMAEHYDEYAAATSGHSQGLRWETIDVCDDCPAWYNRTAEEWLYE